MAKSGGSDDSVSLQELIKANPSVGVPSQYLRLDQEPSIISINDDSSAIPVIDMKELIMGENKDFELQKLHSTCKEWGIFQLVNHGVESSLVEKLKDEIEGFYRLPLEEKMRYKRKEGDVEGYGQTIIHSQDQKADWGDRFYMITNPITRRKPLLLPQFPPSLRETLEAYLAELQELAMSLFGIMARALEIDEEEIKEMFEDGMQSIRMTYYPPCAQPDLVVGLTPHSDATGITILLQVNDVDGLEVKKDGVWIPVKILPHALVINLGDILEEMLKMVAKKRARREGSSSQPGVPTEVEYAATLFVSKQAEKHYNKHETFRTCIHQRGFGPIEDLPAEFQLEIRSRHWEQFCKLSPPGEVALVKEFYANATEAVDYQARVRNRTIIFSPKFINDLFGLVAPWSTRNQEPNMPRVIQKITSGEVK